MCIGFPGKIISIDENNFAMLDIGGVRREACLDVIDQEVAVGDYVLCHAGFAIHKVDEEAAKESLELLREMVEHEIY